MRRIHLGRPRPRNRLADHLAAPKLIASEVDFDPGWEPVPHVRLDAFPVEKDVGSEELATEQVVDDERGDVALPAAWILRRPVVLGVRGVEAPRFADRLLELPQRERQR